MNEEVLSAEKGRLRTAHTQKDRVIQNGGQMPRKAPTRLPRQRSGRKAGALPDPVPIPPIRGRGVFETFEGLEFYRHLSPHFSVPYAISSAIFGEVNASDPGLYAFLIKQLRELSPTPPSMAPGLFVPSSKWVDQFRELAAVWCRMSEGKRNRVYAPIDILRQAFKICHRAIPRFTMLAPGHVEPAIEALRSGGATRLLIADAAHVDLRLINRFVPQMRKFMKHIGIKSTRAVNWKPLKTLDDFIVWYRVEIEARGSVERFAEKEAKARESGRAGSGPRRAARIRKMAAEAIKQAHAFMKA